MSQNANVIDPDLLALLVCPVDHAALELKDSDLICTSAAGHIQSSTAFQTWWSRTDGRTDVRRSRYTRQMTDRAAVQPNPASDQQTRERIVSARQRNEDQRVDG